MKIKKRNQKIICIAVSVLLIAVFLCAPVSAADIYTTTFTFLVTDGVNGLEPGYIKYADIIEDFNNQDWNDINSVSSIYEWTANSGTTYHGYGGEWSWPNNSDNAGVVSFYIGRSRFGSDGTDSTGFAQSDTIWTDPFSMAVALGREYTGATYYRISFREVTAGGTIGKYVGTTGWKRDSMSTVQGNAVFIIDVPSYKMNIVNPGNYYGLSVHIEFQVSSMLRQMSFGLSDGALTINYGRGSSPDFPIYSKPDNSVEDDFIQQGDQIIQDNVVEGFEAFKSEVNAFVVPLEIVQGLTVISTLMSGIVNRIPGFTTFVMLSLILGIFACALGLAGSIIGAAGGLLSKIEHKKFVQARQSRRR